MEIPGKILGEIPGDIPGKILGEVPGKILGEISDFNRIEFLIRSRLFGFAKKCLSSL